MKMFYAAINMVNNRHMVEDAVHEAFLRLAVKYSKYKTYSDERMIDMLRKDRNVDLKDINDYEEEFISDKTVIESIILNEERSALRQGIEKLTETSRNILELKYFNGLNNGEIAHILEIPTKQAEVRLYRAKEALRKVLDME